MSMATNILEKTISDTDDLEVMQDIYLNVLVDVEQKELLLGNSSSSFLSV